MSEYKKDSLLVYLDKKGCPIEWIKAITDFYEERRKAHPVYQPYPNKLDQDANYPFGRHKGKRMEDPTIPDSYHRWVLQQEKMLMSYPVFTNALKKYCEKVNIIE